MQDVGYACYLRVRIKPDKRGEFIGLIHRLREDTRREMTGVVFYEFLATADPLEFVLLQGFVDEAAYKRYANAPFHLEMAPHGWACLDGDPHIEFLSPVPVP
jgi:(4S)-4-hydroxy-5-phosphonooxypentane-2,3-dione isomerase